MTSHIDLRLQSQPHRSTTPVWSRHDQPPRSTTPVSATSICDSSLSHIDLRLQSQPHRSVTPVWSRFDQSSRSTTLVSVTSIYDSSLMKVWPATSIYDSSLSHIDLRLQSQPHRSTTPVSATSIYDSSLIKAWPAISIYDSIQIKVWPATSASSDLYPALSTSSYEHCLSHCATSTTPIITSAMSAITNLTPAMPVICDVTLPCQLSLLCASRHSTLTWLLTRLSSQAELQLVQLVLLNPQIFAFITERTQT